MADVGFTSGPIGDVAEQAQGSDQYPASNTSALDLFGTTKQLFRFGKNMAAEGGVQDEFGNELIPPEPTISADDANAKYGITPPSGFKPLRFTTAVPESVASSLHDAKVDELQRNDAAARQPGGFGNAAIRTGLDLATGMLDPVNAAALFVPGLGEGRVASMLGVEGVESLAARSAVRLGEGASQGFTGTAALTGLQYGISQQDQSDFSATDALSQIAMGTVMGGGLHTLIGGVGDVIGNRFKGSPAAGIVDNDPVTRDAALRASVAAVAEDRPVDVSSLIDLGGAEAEHADTLNSLRDEAAGLRRDIEQVPGAAADPDTQARIEAVENQLTDPSTTLSEGQRFELEQEHQMLTEGSAPTDQDALDEARGQSQREGLQAHLDRTNQRILDLQDTIRNSEAARRANGTSEDPAIKAVSDNAERTVAAAKPEDPAAMPEPNAMAQLEASVKALREPVKSTIGGDEIKAAGATPDGYDMTKGGNAVVSRVSEALDNGGKVTLHVEGKAVNITKIDRGMMQDDQGQRWGTMALAAQKADEIGEDGKPVPSKNRIEIETAPRMDADTAALYDQLSEQAKTDEGTAKALEAAAQCMMGAM